MKQFEANVVGPFLVTRALLPNLKLAAKTSVVVHGQHRQQQRRLLNLRLPRVKVGHNMINSSLYIDLKGDGNAAVALHPDYVVTDLTGGLGNVHTDEGVAGMACVLNKLTLADTEKKKKSTSRGKKLSGEPLRRAFVVRQF